MEISDFEKLMVKMKMKIEERHPLDGKELYICEGYSRGDRDDPAPHYKTMFAFADDPYHITLGEFFTTPILFPLPSKEARMAEARGRGVQFYKDMNANG